MTSTVPPPIRRPPPQLASLLRQVAVHDGWRLPPPPSEAGLDQAALVDAARYHRLTGPLYLSLRDHGHPTAAALAGDHSGAIVHHLRALAALRDVEGALGAAGIPWLVFKGPALACLSYPRPDLRSYADVDLLVRPRDAGAAVAALEGIGCRLLERNWDVVRASRPGELHLSSPSGVNVDLHFHLINQAGERDRFRVDSGSALDRAEPVTLGARQYLTLDAVDTIINLCLHTALSGGNRLGWFSDIDQTWRSRPPDAGLLVERAREWGVALAVHLALARARRTVGAPVPTAVLRELSASRGWSALTAAVDARYPVARATGGRSPARALATNVRPGATSTLGALVRSRWSRMRGLTGGAVAADPAGMPAAMRHASGGARGREEFFASLERPEVR